MKQGHALKNESPRDRARSAMGRLWSITWNEEAGQAEGDETVRMGLDAMASALVDWKDLELPNAAPLDEVLAELGEDDDVVETVGQLIDLVGRASYAGGLSREEVEQAEQLREELVETLDELLTRLDEEEHEDADA